VELTVSLFVVLCNCPVDQAPVLARGLVEARLAACVNLIAGVTSVYRWQGEVCEDPETTLVIKVPVERYEPLAAWLTEQHPYDVPEIIALPASHVHEPYLAWARDMTS